MRNPFASIFMPDGDSKKRVSIPVETIREIQQSCYAIDDDMRWLVALISDTGMRLAEAAGLHMDDLHLDDAGALCGNKASSVAVTKDQRQSEASAIGWCIAMGSTAYQSKRVFMLCLPTVY